MAYIDRHIYSDEVMCSDLIDAECNGEPLKHKRPGGFPPGPPCGTLLCLTDSALSPQH